MTVERFKKLYSDPTLCSYIKKQAARHFPKDGFEDACQEGWAAIWVTCDRCTMDDLKRIAYNAIQVYHDGEVKERHPALEELDFLHSIYER